METAAVRTRIQVVWAKSGDEPLTYPIRKRYKTTQVPHARNLTK